MFLLMKSQMIFSARSTIQPSRDHNVQIQREMFETVQRWVNETPASSPNQPAAFL